MIAKSTILWIAVSCVASGVLYQTSYQAQEQERELARLNRAITVEQDSIQVLKAEWAYLNEPARLERLVSEHLLMQPTTAQQIAALTDIPDRNPDQPAPHTPIPGRKPGTPKPDMIDRAPRTAPVPTPPQRQPEGPMLLARYGATR
ncbi:cell division protein FtsL [Niveispirillum fermenti]|uniref:cell division protein FtsL n=1 Tax=Niveispirillum fermenti TaxID=1233113 RepID=UPI003A85C094